ncbi:STAS domain-containing protein [Streptomyces sporangiiformans]|uniref:Anti-sigma factor antagonist n=1 Tax=Streptomyces sporangiiformans TaxID=2315329 RepID=A0A505CTM2_9ACTN|nr:STAS domain-containing protein [Streptomyces sporangiiformans]TPQ15473.1 STAS domain-containing protein [Streptomyces sporangiiformans]
MGADTCAFGLDERVVGAATVIELRGEVDIHAAQVLAPRVDELIARSATEVVVDLGAVTFLDCGGLRLLDRIQNRTARRGGTMWCVRGADPVMRVFRITGLESALSFHERLTPTI